MKKLVKWESIGQSHWRAKVFGGWLVTGEQFDDQQGSMVFVPDPKYTWGTDEWLEFMKEYHGHEQ